MCDFQGNEKPPLEEFFSKAAILIAKILKSKQVVFKNKKAAKSELLPVKRTEKKLKNFLHSPAGMPGCGNRRFGCSA